MTVLKTIATILTVSLRLTSCGQTSINSHVKTNPNKIDSLQTDKDVFAFIKQQFPEYKKTISFDDYWNETKQVADSLKVKRWIKTDIDNNGETDLLIFGANNLSNIFGVLSLENKFKQIPATYFCKYQFIYPVLTTLDNQNVILLYNQNQIDYDRNIKHFIYTKLACDTLMVKDTLFINYVHSPIHTTIEKIELYNDGICKGNCPRINIIINPKTFENSCTQEMYWDNKPQTSTGQLTQAEIKKILFLLDYSNFTNLKEIYEVGCTDQPTTTLTITYDNGKVKSIKDYASTGNFTLAEIYKTAYNIKWTVQKGSR
jgi:hypothetical protein